MNQPKLAITIDEAQRVVRQLADSLNSLKTKPGPPACLRAGSRTTTFPDRKKIGCRWSGQSAAPCQLFDECRRNQLRAPLR